jgi:TonB family protein
MAGAGIGLLLLLTGLARLAWLVATARRLEGGCWSDAARAIAAEIGLRRPVALLLTSSPALLVAWGAFRPKVLLPMAAAGWPRERAEIVLRHELAHIRRRDWIAQMTGELLRTVYWFNPLVWIACGRLRQESERACDDAVLNGGVDAADYATHLVELACVLKGRGQGWLPAPAMARPSSLEGRISAMLSPHIDRRPPTSARRFATATAFFVLALSLAGLGAQASFVTFSGSLIDVTNRPLPGAQLLLTNAASQARHEVKSDRMGRFEFVGLPPGDYALEIKLLGFAPYRQLLSASGRNIEQTIALEVGSLEETITVLASVEAAAPAPSAEERAAAQARLQASQLRARERVAAAIAECRKRDPSGPGGNILPPLKIRDMKPVYPEHLGRAGVAGIVTMQARIGTDGNIEDVRVISTPHVDLEHAAVEAVRQWQFSQTLLNCTPIEVQMRVTANFRTNR